MVQILTIQSKQKVQVLCQISINLKIAIIREGLILKSKYQIVVIRITAGTRPISVLIKAVTTRAEIISLIFKGDINKFVKFLLQIYIKKHIKTYARSKKNVIRNCTSKYYT